jgi:hypothetical protein
MSLMSRRALLRSAGVAAGTVAVAGVGDSDASASPLARTFRLHGSQLRTLSRAGTHEGEHVTVVGRLHHDAGGPVVGQLYSSATVLSHDVVDDGSPTRLELHLLQLEDGTLTATGTVTVTGRGAFTITGGSGRYALARGTYTTVQSADTSGGGEAVITIDLH